QTRGAIVRNNVAEKNVAGLEVENTQFVEVYGNQVQDNTAGLVVFDLPGNPVVGRDVYIHHNVIAENNRGNFAPTDGVNAVTTVSQIPAGTGTFALASRRVRISDNFYFQNDSAALSILSGLVIQSDPARWAIPDDMVIGDISGLNLEAVPGAVLNFRSKEVLIENNDFFENGNMPDGADPMQRPIGALLAVTYEIGSMGAAVDEILYDGIEEMVEPGTVLGGNTNNNRVCLSGNAGALYATLDLPRLEVLATRALVGQGPPPTLEDIYRPAEPFAPFDCTSLTGDPVGAVTLPIAN
ncbi:MAG: parallel beta-helix domain-containing protein, partial [Myxococcota bacterium]